MRRRGQSAETAFLVVTVMIAIIILAIITQFYARIPTFELGAKAASQKITRLIFERGYGTESVHPVEFVAGERIFRPEVVGATPIDPARLTLACVNPELCGPDKPLEAHEGRSLEARQRILGAVAACTNGYSYLLTAAGTEEAARRECELRLQQLPKRPARPTEGAGGEGILRVLVSQRGARSAVLLKVLVDNQQKATGSLETETKQLILGSYPSDGEHAVRAEAEGCTPVEKRVVIRAPVTEEELVLECAPALAKLTVVVEKRGTDAAVAKLSIDGRVAQAQLPVIGTYTEDVPAERSYKLRAEAEGCLPDEKSVFMRTPGATERLMLECRKGKLEMHAELESTEPARPPMVPDDALFVLKGPDVEYRYPAPTTQFQRVPIGRYDASTTGSACTGASQSVVVAEEPFPNPPLYLNLRCPPLPLQKIITAHVRFTNYLEQEATFTWSVSIDSQLKVPNTETRVGGARVETITDASGRTYRRNPLAFPSDSAYPDIPHTYADGTKHTARLEVTCKPGKVSPASKEEMFTIRNGFGEFFFEVECNP